MIQQKYSQIKLPQRSPVLYFIEFRLGAPQRNGDLDEANYTTLPTSIHDNIKQNLNLSIKEMKKLQLSGLVKSFPFPTWLFSVIGVRD